MSNQLQVIEQNLKSDTTANEIAIALGNDPNDEQAMNKAMKYAYGVHSTIAASVGTKNDISTCNVASIKATMIEAANRGVYIDGRQHAYLIKYGQNCTFQMGFRGYLAKIKEFYPDADFVVEPVYTGDDIKIWNDNGSQQYTHAKAGAFRSGEKDFLGILFAVTYTDNGRLVQRVADIPKERIDRARRAAKADYVWKSDYIEKAKAAAVKNACKHLFASLQGLQDIVNYDNQNYNPNKNQPATPVRKSVIDNINQSVDDKPPEQAVKDTPQDDETVIEGDCTKVDETPVKNAPNEEYAKQVIADGEKAVQGGFRVYAEWVGKLEESDKDIVRDNHKGWTEQAREISKAQTAEETTPTNDAPPVEATDNDAPPI